MTLQILVNHYKEDEEIVERFLSSLAMQKNVDFSVIIGSDGGIKLDESFLKKFGLDLEYLYLEHSGVCHTRNVLMDRSTADYIMFCDIDDCFHSDKGLQWMMQTAKESDGEVIGSAYTVETYRKDRNSYHYCTNERDTVRVHGKIFKREFLVNNSIRFPDELETSGDMMFTWLCYTLSSKIIWVKNNFYIWKYNKNSVTRENDFEIVYHYSRTIRCFTLLAEDLKRRNRTDLLNTLIATLFPMLYFDSTSDLWTHAPGEYLEDARSAIEGCLNRYISVFDGISEELKRVGYEKEKTAKPLARSNCSYEEMVEWIGGFRQEQTISRKHNVLIVGHGVVGSNLEKELSALKLDIYDKYKQTDTRKCKKYDLAFICVDTPATKECDCDTSEVKNAIMENDAEIYVIKSTVLPGTTDRIAEETKKHILFSPEYYGGTQHCNNFDFDFTILGGEKEDCFRVVQILQDVYDGRHQFRITDAKTAELVKYMENSYLATKVSFCNQFYNIANDIGVNYEELRELFVLDPRVEPSHTFVYGERPYWNSHCLNKDVPAIAKHFDAPLLLGIIDFNNHQKDASLINTET